MKVAPVALFVYNRPLHAKRVLEALQKNTLAGSTDLFIFSDGPKKEITDEGLRQIDDVRKLIKGIQGFKSVTIVESTVNQGLSASITKGISQVFENHDRIIVLEDDILAHSSFLEFCNHALEEYKNNEHVFAISGFSFPLKAKLPATYFIQFGATWGWACWKRSWKHFTMDSGKLINEIEVKGRVREFDFDCNYHFYEMLKQHHEGKISSWDVCWYASIFIANGLTYYPTRSLTINIGMDGSGTHYSGTAAAGEMNDAFSISDRECRDILNHRPSETEVNSVAQRALTGYFYSYQKGGLINRVKHMVRKVIQTKT